jgi:hypothetical protein
VAFLASSSRWGDLQSDGCFTEDQSYLVPNTTQRLLSYSDNVSIHLPELQGELENVPNIITYL